MNIYAIRTNPAMTNVKVMETVKYLKNYFPGSLIFYQSSNFTCPCIVPNYNLLIHIFKIKSNLCQYC